jgi:hypothetical protein
MAAVSHALTDSMAATDSMMDSMAATDSVTNSMVSTGDELQERDGVNGSGGS